MKERPILFSGEMVRAILDGTKTMMRSVVKLDEFGPSDTPGYDFTFRKDGLLHDVRLADMLNPPLMLPGEAHQCPILGKILPPVPVIFAGILLQPIPQNPRRNFPGTCPYGTIGDRLWVRETWAPHPQDPSTIFYRATVESEPGIRVWDGPWRPSIHMPRWASRITLEITGIRVERVQDISEEDARAEGVGAHGGWNADETEYGVNARGPFSHLWDSINAKRHPWASNPWVWVIEFREAE